jgi:hypothetical protein
VLRRRKPARFGQRADRPAHGLVCDLDEAVHDLIKLHLALLLAVDLLRELLEGALRRGDVETLVLVLAEDLREVVRDEPAEQQIRVRHRQRPTFPVHEPQHYLFAECER